MSVPSVLSSISVLCKPVTVLRTDETLIGKGLQRNTHFTPMRLYIKGKRNVYVSDVVLTEIFIVAVIMVYNARRFTAISYPLRLSGSNLDVSVDADVVTEAIRSTLQTRLTERVMIPRYGLDIDIFDTTQADKITALVERALTDNVLSDYPGVSFTVNSVLLEDGVATVVVTYSVGKAYENSVQLTLNNLS